MDNPRDLDFSSLPALQELVSFKLHCKDDFRCTVEQVGYLTQCMSLMELNCGSWSPIRIDEAKENEEENAAEAPSIEQQLEEGIGAFVQSRSNSSTSVSNFVLNATIMTPAIWSHLVQLTSVESIQPINWCIGMTSQQWNQLTRFTRLERLVITPATDELNEDGHSSMKMADFLPSLLQCHGLTFLGFGRGLELSREDTHAIATQLPSLSELILCMVWVENLAPLIASPMLSVLALNGCSDLQGNSPSFLTTLPSLPHLTELEINDQEDHQMTAAQADPLHIALLARMPMLKADKFTHVVVEAAAEPVNPVNLVNP